jgi:hypothetical protein
MWLNVHTSKRPEVILPFFLGAAEKHGCPDVIVADHVWHIACGVGRQRELEHHDRQRGL